MGREVTEGYPPDLMEVRIAPLLGGQVRNGHTSGFECRVAEHHPLPFVCVIHHQRCDCAKMRQTEDAVK
jgi:hypothetical protein